MSQSYGKKVAMLLINLPKNCFLVKKRKIQ